MTFRCSRAMRPHCESVLAGEYDVPGLSFEGPITILDIGAHAGAFSLWAIRRWPSAQIIAYEPQPDVFENYLHPNTCDEPGIVRGCVAVRAEAGKAVLHRGRNNQGEASFHNDNPDTIEVDCVAAKDLPFSHVLKIDTEGCEVEILHGYLSDFWPGPKAILLEFHSAEDRRRIDNQLAIRGYDLIRGQIHHKDMGTLCYVRP